MKYMTPDLLGRLQDENTVDATSEEWDKALAAYKKRLLSIRKKLPPGARTLSRRYDPHDAEVLVAAINKEHPVAVILLRLDEPGNRIILLDYHLLKKPEVVKHPSLGEFGRPWQKWLYDEFDTVEENGVNYFSHSILLSGGQELKLSFLDMDCKPIEVMLSASGVEHGLELQPA
jgi:hypothetical protein